MNKTVLIVDDVAFVRKTLAEILGEAGYRVVAEASDGREAIERYAEFKPDLVTMDAAAGKLNLWGVGQSATGSSNGIELSMLTTSTSVYKSASSATDAITAKMGIDATKPLGEFASTLTISPQAISSERD